MNDITVGMENLPNVFIDKIDLYPMFQPNTQQIYKYKIEVKLCMYDHSPRRSWYQREDLASLNIKVVFRGGEAGISLDNGSDSLYDHAPSEPGVIVVGQQVFVIEEELNSYTKLSTKIVTETPALVDLNVYSACFIGDLDLGNDLFNKFYGPMSAEKIFVGGQINRQSGHFYYPDTNEEYAGPVHQHTSGEYMEGSQHSDDPHKNLIYAVDENYKIRSSAEVGFGPLGATPSLNVLADTFLSNQAAGAPDTLDVPIDTSVDLEPAYGSLSSPVLTEADTVQVNTELTDPFTQRPQAQNLLADVSFEVRDAIRRGIY